MKVTVEELSTVKKAIRVEIPQETVSKEFSHAYAELNKRVRIPGFRPGRAPLSLLQKRYGSTVKEDVLRKLIPDYYDQAIKQVGVTPVQLPAIEKVDIKEDAPLTFTATVEVHPRITLAEYGQIRLTKRKVTVSPPQVEEALSRIREEQGRLESCEEGHAICEKDCVIMDFIGSVDGVPLPNGKREGVLIQVGAGKILPGFDEQLIGMKKGETGTLEVTLLEDFSDPRFRGKRAIFTVTIQEVKTKVLPPLDDELAKDLGVESVDTLRKKVHEKIYQRLAREEENERKGALVKQLIELHSFEVPSSLVEEEIDRILSRIAQEQKKETSDLEEEREQHRQHAIDRVKGSMILSAIAQREGVSVSDQEVEQEIERIAQEVKGRPEEVKRLFISREGSLEGFRARFLEEKILALLLSRGTENEG